jgi:hypothetical protein
MISNSEETVLLTFRQYLMTPNKMLCFYGPTLEQNEAALESLLAKDMLVRESFNGAYSLTNAGYAAMKKCE